MSHGSKRFGQRGWKRQPGGTSVGSGSSPLSSSRFPPPPAAGTGTAVDQRLRVGMLRALDHVDRRSLLDDPAQIHDRDPVAQRPGEAEVVGDEDQRQVAAPLELEQHGEDLRPHRGVEHRDRLVADQPLGLEHQGRGDRDPLALAAGELVRVAVGEALGLEADVVERAAAPAPRARLVATPWTRSGSATIADTRWRGLSVW